MYADYDFYLNDYKGSIIPNAPSYDRVAIEAGAYLNYITRNRIIHNDGDGDSGSVSVHNAMYGDEIIATVLGVDGNSPTINVPETVLYKVQLAQCAIADVCYKQAQDDVTNVVSSESVGNHSVTYAVSKVGYKQRELEKYSKAKIYLHGTGLLYGGLR